MFKPRGKTLQSSSYNLPAPVGGLDATSSLMQMRESRSILCENFFPQPDGLVLRDGYVNHVTGFAHAPDRLHVYAATGGGESLWACTVDGIFDATAAGAVGATVMALTAGGTVSTTIATGAGNYMMLVNGVDTLKKYDGATWTSVATFGATATSVYSYTETYRQRLFLVKKNSLEIEYLAANSIAGIATNYPLGAIFRLGGYIVALATWTIDGGFGPEDNLAIITNKGEVAVFAGADPATWAQKGVYFIGRPMGGTPFYKYGGDLLVITENGIYPLSAAVQSTSIDRVKTVSQDIRQTLVSAAASFSNNSGWQIISQPLGPFLLVNIPSSPIRKQAIMHAQTGAWTFYSGWDALYFARMAEELYFSTATAIYRINGVSDLGTNIVGTLSQAYARLRFGANKKIELIRPYISSNGGFHFQMGINSNFAAAKELTDINAKGNITPALWGSALWGSGMWTGDTEILQDWQTVPDEFSLWKSLYIKITSNNARVLYLGSDIKFVPGGDF